MDVMHIIKRLKEFEDLLTSEEVNINSLVF